MRIPVVVIVMLFLFSVSLKSDLAIRFALDNKMCDKVAPVTSGWEL